MNTRHSPAKATLNPDPVSGTKTMNKNSSKTPSKKTARKSTSKNSDKHLPSKPGSRFSEQPQDIEISLDGDDFEIEPDQSNRIEKKKSSPRKGTVPAAPGNVDFEKPFKLGWGRELVIHGKPGSNLKHDVDVCYFSPEGKKLKTRTEIKAHLLKTKSSLTIDSFTFETETVYEEPFEIIRYTGKPKGKGKSKKSADFEKSCDPQPSSSKEVTRRRSLEKSIGENEIKNRHHSVEKKDGADTHISTKEYSVDCSLKTVDNVKTNVETKSITNSDDTANSGKTTEVSPKTLGNQRRSKRRSRSSASKSLTEDDSFKTADFETNKLEERIENDNETIGTDKAASKKDGNVEIPTIETGEKNDMVTSANVDTHNIDIRSDSIYTKTVLTIEGNDFDETKDNENMETDEYEAQEKDSDCLGIKISSVESIADNANKMTENHTHETKMGTQNNTNLDERDNKQRETIAVEPENTSTSEKSQAQAQTRSENTKIGNTKRKQDLKSRLIVGSNWLKMKPKTPKDTVIQKESAVSLGVSKRPRIIGTIGSITLQKQNKSSILKAGSKFKSVKSSSSLVAKSSMMSRSIIIPKSNVRTNVKVIRAGDSRTNISMSKNSENTSADISPSNKRRRTLPARLRDYAVVDAKDTESSQGSEEESENEEDGDMNSDMAEQEHFISNVNPSADELISSVLGPKRGNVAKKHTGKRKLTGSDALHPDAAAAKKKKAIAQTNGTVVPSKEDTRVMCDLHCEGHVGLPPSLQCELCMCLYHPKCLHMQGTTLKSFICPNCRTSKPSGAIAVSAALPPSVNTASVSGSRVIVVGPTGPKFSTTRTGNSVNVVQTNTKTITASLPIASKAEPWELRKLRATKDKVNKQIINLPQEIAKNLDFNKGVSLKYHGITYRIPPSCFETKGTSVKLLLPPDTLPNYICKGGTDNPVSISSGKPGSNLLSMYQLNSHSHPNEMTTANKENNVLTQQQEQRKSILASLFPQKPIEIDDPMEIAMNIEETEPLGSSVQKAKRTGKPKGRPRKRPVVKTTKYSQSVCNFQMLHVGFDCMINIFEYLTLSDLMRASRVCRTWQRVASQSVLWKSVRLRGFRITDWPAAVNCFQERNTRKIDLRGMLHLNNDACATWQEFHNELQLLACVRHLDLPQCPASALHAITDKLGMIQHIAAESIIENVKEPMSSNAKLDLGKFAKLTRLQVLKLRGSVGLVQPSFSFSGGLSELSNLAHLHTLCVTTLRDLSGSEFGFLGSLTNLHTLSIGDCNLWTQQNFEDLGKLEKLKFLRLESGGHLKEASLGKALGKMPKLESLELFKFVISYDLADSLQTIVWLRTFSIFSETNSQAAAVNTNTMTALTNMPFLTTVQWGIFDSADSNSKIPADSIPIMPPDGEDGMDKRAENVEEVRPDYVKVNDLVQKLSSHLTDTVIRVFRVPNVSSRRPLPSTS